MYNEINVLLLACRREMEAESTVRLLWNDAGVKAAVLIPPGEATVTCGGLMKMEVFFFEVFFPDPFLPCHVPLSLVGEGGEQEVLFEIGPLLNQDGFN